MGERIVTAPTLDPDEARELAEDLTSAVAALRYWTRGSGADGTILAKKIERHRKLAARLDAWALELDPPDDGAVYHDAAGQRTETR